MNTPKTNNERLCESVVRDDLLMEQRGAATVLQARPKLRVGLILDSLVQPIWVRRMIEEIKGSHFAEQTVVIVKEEVAASSNSKRRAPKEPFLVRLYSRMDEHTETPYADPLERVDLTQYLNGFDTELVVPERAEGEDSLDTSDINRLIQYSLDVLVDLRFTSTSGAALQAARFGIWSYRPSGKVSHCQGPPGFWEVIYGEVVTELNLLMFTESHPEGTVLSRCTTSTDLLSPKANRCKHCWKAAFSLPRTLRLLHQTESGFLKTCGANASGIPRNRRPGGLETAWSLIKMGGRRMHRAARDTWLKERWFLAYMMEDFDPASGVAPRPKYIEPPKDRFWADPFPLVRDSKYYIFLEEYLYDEKKAHLSVMEMDSSGKWEMPTKVLDCPYHLSYPFVFEWDGRMYMIPETKGNNCIALFRCNKFPLEWSFDRVLVENVRAVDATIHLSEGLWWLFCSIGGTYFPSNDELHVYYAETPVGPWHPHKLNPVKTDVRSSRPAGKLFFKDGQLYRPSQDCSVRMGGAIVVNRVVRITTEEFREEEVVRIDPSWKWGLYGVHTVNKAGSLTMLDCFGYVRKRP